MAVTLKPLREQVVVLTGATSGIGLATARRMARRGARVALAARDPAALDKLADELGGKTLAVPTDVSREDEVRALADRATEAFGPIDTWVNDAGIAAYGTIAETPIEDQRRLFEVNYWGMVYGSRVAAERMRRRGGAIVNLGSVLGDRAIPMQGAYSATKHAIKAFTDALRMELEKDRAPISVTLIRPSAIDTPYRHHAANYQGVEAVNPPPVYSADLVAEAVCHAAETPIRDITVGFGGRAIALMGQLFPRATDRVMEAVLPFLQRRGTRPPTQSEPTGSLYKPGSAGEQSGGSPWPVMRNSPYQFVSRHPRALAGAALAVLALRASR